MAYSITFSDFITRKNDKAFCRIEAVLDSVDDLEALGTDYAPGSIAMVATTDVPTFMMNASGEWKEV